MKIIIPTPHEKSILADLTFSQGGGKSPIIIFCHGYKGYKDWGAWNLVAKWFAREGFNFLKFNFSHNGGTLEQPIDFPDLDAFGKNTYSLEMLDLGAVIDWTIEQGYDIIDKNQIYLIGHSRGGGIVTLKAAQDQRIKKVISWAGVSDFKSRFPRGDKMKDWKENGVYYVKNGRTKQEMPHYFSFYQDFIENEANLTISTAVKAMKIPQLIIHGDHDEAVGLSEANQLKQWNPNAGLKIIAGAGHTFDLKQPWDDFDLPEVMLEVMKNSYNFFRKG